MKISELINAYVDNTDKLNKMNTKVKELRDYNKKLSDGIIGFMEKTNKNDITFNNSLFEKKNNTVQGTISQKLLKDSLNKFFDDKTKADELYKYILSNRTNSIKTELKCKKLS